MRECPNCGEDAFYGRIGDGWGNLLDCYHCFDCDLDFGIDDPPPSKPSRSTTA